MTKTIAVPIMESKVDVSKVTRIDADVLIPGKGNPVKNASLVWKEKKIVHVGETKNLPQEYVSIQSVKVPVLMPGMWDCHGTFSTDAVHSRKLHQLNYSSTLHRSEQHFP